MGLNNLQDKSKIKPLVFKPATSYSKKFDTPATQAKDYYPSWAEFAAGNFEQIYIENTKTTATEETIYAVPANRIFMITRASLSLTTLGDNGGENAVLSIGTAAQKKIFLELNGTDGAAVGIVTTNETHADFIMPLKIQSGQAIRQDNPTGGASSAIIIGFLVPFIV